MAAAYAGRLKLSPGGYVVIDDYSLETCRAAVDDFRKERGIRDDLQVIDWTGVFWIKSGVEPWFEAPDRTPVAPTPCTGTTSTSEARQARSARGLSFGAPAR